MRSSALAREQPWEKKQAFQRDIQFACHRAVPEI
jgi:hypothetical protein